ncbi:MAG: hypothetical protein AAFO01_00640 [Pseudomonadota bacterium]
MAQWQEDEETVEPDTHHQSEPVKLLTRTVLRGRNPYHTSTVVRQTFDFGSLQAVRSGEIGSGFAEQFIESFRTLRRALPNGDFSRDFFQRLSEPPGVAIEEAVLEAIMALEATLAFERGRLDAEIFGMIEPVDIARQTALIWPSNSPNTSRQVAEIGLAGVIALLPAHYAKMPSPDVSALEDHFAKLRRRVRRRRPTAGAAALAAAAPGQGIACQVLGGDRLRLGQGAFQRTIAVSTSINAVGLTDDSNDVMQRLADVGLPVPQRYRPALERQAADSLEPARAGVLVNLPGPARHDQGPSPIDASARIISVADQTEAPREDRSVDGGFGGQDFSLLVIDGRYTAAVRRMPPIIEGDGESTTKDLVRQLNRDPFRDDFRMMRVPIDDDLINHLGKQGVRLDDVLPAGRVVSLRSSPSISAGGAAIDVTDEVHHDNRMLAERVGKVLDQDFISIDFVTTDISRSYKVGVGTIMKINAEPELHGYLWPRHSKRDGLAPTVLAHLLKGRAEVQIPASLIAGDRGTGRIARELDGLLRGNRRSVGLVTRHGAFINGEALDIPDSRRRRSLGLLIHDPRIEALVGAVSLRQIVKRGMQLETCQSSAITSRNVDGDVDLFRKGMDVLIRATLGHIVVSADDVLALDAVRMVEASRVILVTPRRQGNTLERHLAEGGPAIVTRWREDQEQIVLIEAGEPILTLPTGETGRPSPRRPQKRSIEARMFALALAHGLGLQVSELEQAIGQAPDLVPTVKREGRPDPAAAVSGLP